MNTINVRISGQPCNEFKKGSSVWSLLQQSGASVNCVAARVNDVLVDLSFEVEEDCNIQPLGAKDAEGLDILRHDLAHIMLQALKEIYGSVKGNIGPTTDIGFFYDVQTKSPVSEGDLSKIEERMREIITRSLPFERKVLSRSDAISIFENSGDNFKLNLINKVPAGESISIYSQGDMIDLCKGPHSPSTNNPLAFKLTKVSGVSYKDDHSATLQRIQGVAFHTQEELDSYFRQQEEALKRDHRRIGQDLDLFHIDEGTRGQVFWHEKGYILYRIIENYIRERLNQNGYVEVKTPVLLNRELWERSGHWEKFKENMFVIENDDESFAIKPMSCPCHIKIFNNGIKSYRDLPIRMAEFGHCHRNEPSGSLHGLMRVRGFVQDDAHIFCTPEQIKEETQSFCDLLVSIYRDFGFNEIQVMFSDRPRIRAGNDEIWDKAETALMDALKETAMPFAINSGEGAFYGPKLEFVLKDSIGRSWQCGTLQVDYVLPERLGAQYIDTDNQRKTPVVLHRAILGTLERFIGILLESTGGLLPLWLSPVQVDVLPVSEKSVNYANSVLIQLRQAGIRAILSHKDTLSYRIRESTKNKVPICIVVGEKEEALGIVSTRFLGDTTKASCALSVKDFIDLVISKSKA